MPKWLSSTLIAVGLLALILLATLPRSVEVEVTVTNNVRNNATSEKTLNYNGDVYERYYHNGAVKTPPSEEDEDTPEG